MHCALILLWNQTYCTSHSNLITSVTWDLPGNSRWDSGVCWGSQCPDTGLGLCAPRECLAASQRKTFPGQGSLCTVSKEVFLPSRWICYEIKRRWSLPSRAILCQLFNQNHTQIGWTDMLTCGRGTEGPYLEVAMADAVPVASHCSLMMRACSTVTAHSSLQPQFPLTILRGTCAWCLRGFSSRILFWSI